MKIIPLGNCDADVDVCATPDGGWLVASVPIVGVTRQPLRLSWFHRTGEHQAEIANIFTGTGDGGTFPRLAPGGPRIFLAHRAIVNVAPNATLRIVTGHTVTGPDDSYVLGPADGPLALSGDWVAWQASHSNLVLGRRLTVPLGDSKPLRAEQRPTGLSRMDGDRAVFVDEDRLSVPGMFNPVSRYGIVVGEGLTGGIAVRTGEGQPHGTLLPGEICGTPRGARNDDGEYAAVCWGGPGARLVLFSAADLVTT